MSPDDPFDHPLLAFFLSDDPEEVRQASRALPQASSGRVKKPDGLNEHTHRPERDGIYCAKIFGPIDDYRCNCGKITGRDHAGETCDKCGVLLAESKIRNERWAHIDLPAPVLHPRLVATIASKLGCGVANAEAVFVRRANLNDDGSVVRARRSKYGQYEFEDPAQEAREARGPAFIQERLGADADLLITKVPVVPAGWRAVTGAENDAYRRVINRANRLARLLELNAPVIIEHNEEELLQQTFTRLCEGLRAELTAAIAKTKRPPLDSRAAELLAAVYANPGDTDRRAVYADHLLSLGEPRGEFIALQLANAGGSRMTAKEGALLRRYLHAWLHPLDAVLEPNALFRRGFPVRAVTSKGTDEAVAALLGHEAWATIEHLDTSNVELLTHPCLRSLSRLSVDFKTLRKVCAKANVMPRIQALTIRLASSSPRDHAEVTSSRVFPNLSEIMIVCKSKHGEKDFSWLQGTPLVDSLEALVVVIDLFRGHDLPFTFLLEMFSRQPKLQRATLSLGSKQIVYEITRSSEHGSGLAIDLTVNPTAVERILMGTESALILGHIADALEPGSSQITAVTVRIPNGTWGTELFAAFQARLRRTYENLTWLDAKPTAPSDDQEGEA